MPSMNVVKFRRSEKKRQKDLEKEKKRIRSLVEKKPLQCCKCGKIYCDCKVKNDMVSRGWKIVKREGNYWVFDGEDQSLYPIPFGIKEDAWKFALKQYKNPV